MKGLALCTFALLAISTQAAQYYESQSTYHSSLYRPRQLSEESTTEYYDPFVGGEQISVRVRQLGHRASEEYESVGAAMVPAASFASKRQHKLATSKDAPNEETGPGRKQSSKSVLIVGGLALVGLVAGVAVARKSRKKEFSHASIAGLEDAFISIEEEEFDKMLESFGVNEEETEENLNVSIEDFRPPCLDPSNYDPEWSCSITYNETAYFKVIGNYMIDDGEILGVSIYQSGKLSALSDFSNAKLLEEDDPAFIQISELIEQQIRGKILCLQYQKGSRDVVVSDVDTIEETDAAAVLSQGTWYDISIV